MFNPNGAAAAPSRPRQGSTTSLMDSTLTNLTSPRTPTELRPASAPIDIVRPNIIEALTPPSAEVEPGSPPSRSEQHGTFFPSAKSVANAALPVDSKKSEASAAEVEPGSPQPATGSFLLFPMPLVKPLDAVTNPALLDDSMEREDTEASSSENSNHADNKQTHDEPLDLVGIFRFDP